jgi:hypothetical protein
MPCERARSLCNALTHVNLASGRGYVDGGRGYVDGKGFFDDSSSSPRQDEDSYLRHSRTPWSCFIEEETGDLAPLVPISPLPSHPLVSPLVHDFPISPSSLLLPGFPSMNSPSSARPNSYHKVHSCIPPLKDLLNLIFDMRRAIDELKFSLEKVHQCLSWIVSHHVNINSSNLVLAISAQDTTLLGHPIPLPPMTPKGHIHEQVPHTE